MTCTTIEQSRKLLKLGLSPITSDMIHWSINKKDYSTENLYYVDSVNRLRWKGLINDIQGTYVDIIPSWSLEKILNLLPDTITWEEVECDLLFDKTRFEYSGSTFDGEWTEQPWWIEKESMFEAAYETLIWVLENGKF